MRYAKLAAAVTACLMLISSCSNKADSGNIAMTVGDRQITESELKFYITTYKDNIGLGRAKDASVEYCGKNNRIIAVGEAMGIEFDEETKKQIKEEQKTLEERYDANGGYKKFLKENNISDEYMDSLVTVGYYSKALKEKMDKGNFSEEAKREYFKNHYRRAKHILIPTTDSETGAQMSDEKITEAKALAEELLKRAQSGEDFDTLIEQYSQDTASTFSPNGYVFTDDEMLAEFQQGVDSIEPGAFTIAKSDYGYHVIQRLALDETEELFETEYNKVSDTLPTLIENTMFDEQLNAWAEEYGIETTVNSDVLDKIE